MLTDIIYKILAFVVLTPLLGILFRILISLSGDAVLSDTDILFFFLRPAGWACLIVAGALWLAIIALEQASLIGILGADADGQCLGVIGSLRFASTKAIPVVRLTTRIVAYLLLVIAPFLVIAGLVYLTLLTEFDINYYLKEKPPAFMLAVSIGCVLAVVLTIILLRLFSNWFFSLPIVLFEGVRPSQAVQLSKDQACGHRRKLLGWILGWFLATSLLAMAATGLVGLLGRLLVPNADGSLHLMVLAIGVTLLFLIFANLVVNLLSTTSFAAMLFSCYQSIGSSEHVGIPHVNVRELNQDSFGIALTRKRLVAATTIGLVVAMAIGVYAAQSVRLNDDVVIMAHRGSSKAAPENTMAAIRQAIKDGADWVEIDVQETADGEVVVFHDSDFMKLAGVNLKIWDATTSDLQDIDIGSWFASQFSDQRVPTLADVLDECKGKIKINIELKYYGHDKQLEQRVAELVDSREMASQVLAMSLKKDGVKKMKAIRPDWKVGLLMSVAAGNLKTLEADFLAVNAGFATRRLIRDAHANGKEIYVWTVNDAASMSVMISRGVDGLLTDKPALARTVLQQRSELSGPQRLLLEFSGVLGTSPEIAEQ